MKEEQQYSVLVNIDRGVQVVMYLDGIRYSRRYIKWMPTFLFNYFHEIKLRKANYTADALIKEIDS